MSRGVPFATNPLLEVRLPAARSRWLMVMVATAFLALVWKAVDLQLLSNEFLQRQGESRYGRTVVLPASRGKVLDRNGVVLAASLPAQAVWAAPEDVRAEPGQLAKLAKLLDMKESDIQRRIADKDRTFVYLKRQVDAAVAEKVAALRIAGIHQRREYKRYYPNGSTFAHVVGFTNVEDVGQEGVELAQDALLAGTAGSRRVIRDRLNNTIEDVGLIREPRDGSDLQLSIDAKVQHHAASALADAVQAHKAKAGAVVVLDAHTGEVLALANVPDYDPNERKQLSGAQLRNRAITDTFEPGSTMKPFSVALALEAGKVRPGTIVDTAPGRMKIGSNTIGDARPHGELTVEEVIQKSSNIGTVKLAMSLPPQRMWEFYTDVGFGQAPQIGFPGAVAGRLRPYRSWKPIEHATMSYGHGVSVSLMQMARAFTVFANDGLLVQPSIFKADPGRVAGTRVLSEKTARQMRHMLELAAGPGGTAPRAQVPGYRVAGKTGTAYKQENGRYVRRYIASFVGFAPVSDPRLVVAVMIDEPSAGQHYAGQVAAPVFSRIVGDALRALGVPPDAPMSNQVIPADPIQESI